MAKNIRTFKLLNERNTRHKQVSEVKGLRKDLLTILDEGLSKIERDIKAKIGLT
jgi:DNA-binding Xre family transcriptional regulator